MILSFNRNGLKKLSRRLTQKPQITINRIPLSGVVVKHNEIPIGSQTIDAPTIGMNEQNINKTEKRREPLTPKINIMIKETTP